MAKSNWERKDLMDGKERLCSHSLSLLCTPVDFHNPTPEFFFLCVTGPQELNADSADTAALINHGKNIQAQSASSLDRSLKQVLSISRFSCAEPALQSNPKGI
jgi:hypothetical protein